MKLNPISEEQIVTIAKRTTVDTASEEQIATIAKRTTVDTASEEQIATIAKRTTVDTASEEQIVTIAKRTTVDTASEEQIVTVTTTNVTLKDLIVDQKGSDYGTTAMDSVILTTIQPKKKQATVTIQRQTPDFDKLTLNPAKRQSFLGRVNDNLLQLLPDYCLEVTWLSGFDEKHTYTLNKHLIKGRPL